MGQFQNLYSKLSSAIHVPSFDVEQGVELDSFMLGEEFLNLMILICDEANVFYHLAQREGVGIAHTDAIKPPSMSLA